MNGYPVAFERGGIPRRSKRVLVLGLELLGQEDAVGVSPRAHFAVGGNEKNRLVLRRKTDFALCLPVVV